MKQVLLILALISVQAHAQIIYTDVDPDDIYNASNDTCSLDVDNDGNIDFLIVQRTVNAPCPGTGPAACDTSITRPRSWVKVTPQGINAVVTAATFASQLPQGQAITPASAWNNASDQVLLTQGAPACVPFGLLNPPQWYCRPGFYTGSWLDSASVASPMFLGLRFDSAGTTYYGWARLSIPSNGTSFTLKDYAYSSLPDAGIYAGETQCGIPSGLSVNNLDSNTVSLTWQSSTTDTFNLRYRPTGAATWSVIDSITATSFTLAGLAGCTEYEFQVEGICDGLLTGYSASFIRTTLGCGACIELTYCPSYSILTGDEYIAHVAVGTLDNQSGANDGYGDFTAMGTALQIGQSHPITLEPVFVLFDIYPMYLRVYVDLNQNGTFTGPGELAYSTSVFAQGPISGTLNIPANALTGSTRMRVVMVEGDPATTSCDYYNIGETEDYCIELVNNTTSVGEGTHSAKPRVFPNPSDSEVFFDLTGIDAGTSLRIDVLDGIGRTVVSKNMDQGRATVSTSWLADGLYVYRITRSGVEVASGKFQVQH
ncbi:MAG: fibronectin type III domain-containing protein [Flavobacteriales bacterium]|nr:fibronectin type III domain-containing protein [Flavobacteriales bacterium]